MRSIRSTKARPAIRRGEIGQLLAARLNVSRRFADEIVPAFFDLLAEQLEQGTPIDVRAFGRFEVQTWSARLSHLLGGGSHRLPERKYVRFTCSDPLKARVRAGGRSRLRKAGM